MSVVRTTPAKVGALLRRRAKAHKRSVYRGVLAAAHRGKTMIGHHTPSDLGQLSLSWDVREGDPKSNLLAELLNDAPHAGIVEMGARPHKVSAEGWHAIYQWVERHFDERDEDGDVDVYGNDPVVSRITWAIVKKIGREGQKPTYFVRDKLPALHQITVKEINHQLAKLAKKGRL